MTLVLNNYLIVNEEIESASLTIKSIIIYLLFEIFIDRLLLTGFPIYYGIMFQSMYNK